MLIRQEQAETFKIKFQTDFEREAIAHLRSELPEIAEELTDEEMLARIRHCLPRAEAYDLTNQDEALAFIDASYLVGDEEFDTNPDFPWAQRILGKQYLDSREKAEQLLDRAYDENQSMSTE